MTDDAVSRRRLLRTGGTVFAAAGLAGCSGGRESADRTTETPRRRTETTTRWTTRAEPDGTDTHVGMVYATGGLGDNSFNDMAHAGVTKARDRYGVGFENAEPTSAAEVGPLQREFAATDDPDADLICCIGFVQTAGVVANATEFDDQLFMLVDSTAVGEDGELLPNVANYVFKEHQGSFQVGHLAGLLTRREFSAGAGATTGDRTVGFVGGIESPLIEKFEAGYRAGVGHADESVDVLSDYVGSWGDPDTGEQIAREMYEDGADVIYHAAGGSGLGVFRAAQEAGRFAIGVDNHQSRSVPEYSDVILASMVKHVDKAIFRAIASLVQGKLKFRVGTVNALGLLEGGVRAVYGADVAAAIPDEVTRKLDASRRGIIKDEIDVPRTLS